MFPSFSSRLLIIPLFLVVWGVAVWGANADAIWIDEWWTTHYIGAAPNNALNGPVEVIERMEANRIHENNPVGYYVVMHLWYRVVGASDFVLRLFSGLCVMISVALMYQLGRAVGSSRSVVLAAKEKRRAWLDRQWCHVVVWCAVCSRSRLLPITATRCGCMPWLLYGVCWGCYLLALYAWREASRSGAAPHGKCCRPALYPLQHALIIGCWAFPSLRAAQNRRWWQAIGLALGSALLFARIGHHPQHL